MAIRLACARVESLVLGLLIVSSGVESAFAVSPDSSPPSLGRPPIADGIVERYLLHPLGLVDGLLLRVTFRTFLLRCRPKFWNCEISVNNVVQNGHCFACHVKPSFSS